jgi:electron transport complex protein RnfD
MIKVIYALIPGLLVYVIFFGFGILFNILLAIITALSCEALMLKLRKRPIIPFITDGSALVTAILLAISIPAIAPWWIIFLGTAFAIIIAKHLYGGLGYNPFNPAMVGYAVLLISFPREMTSWQLPITLGDNYLGPIDSFLLIFSDTQSGTLALDAISGATPLDYLKTHIGMGEQVPKIIQEGDTFGFLAGSGFEWVNIAFLAGGIWLVNQQIISWHIPASVLGGLTLVALIFFMSNSDATNTYASPIFHLFSGAAILGAFFIATDPVSAATTPKGRIIYGAGIGVLIYVIRAWGGYPDAIAFSVLIMNMCVPMIDYYTKPKTYGHGK